MGVYRSNGSSLCQNDRIYDEFEPGSLSGYPNVGVLLNSDNFTRHRSKGLYEIAVNGELEIEFFQSDVSAISKAQIICYDSTFSTYGIVEKTLSSGKTKISCTIDSAYKYFKILVYHSEDVYNFSGAYITTTGVVNEVYHPNKQNDGYDSIAFNYPLFGKFLGSGRLALPPNYMMKGNKVPLLVYAHGSGGIDSWTAAITSGITSTNLQYYNNEGFAVFDCFPWGTIPTLSGATWNPFQIPGNERAYIEGIKYVCSHFNVDIENVVLLCKSQGGNIGHWACVESEFPFKAVGLFCPTTDPVLQKSNIVFYNEACRSALMQLIDFAGTETEKNTFVSSGLVTNSTVMSFLEKNKGLIVAMMPYAREIQNAQSVDELFDGGLETLDTCPQWLLDLGLPARQSAYDLIPKFAEKSYYAKAGKRPIKFWCAIDDAQTSTYGNYAIYQYLLNGGSDAEFRFMTPGTGGHSSMDSANNAEKTSGTTYLGISYSNIAVGCVEAAEFFHRYV